MKCLYVGLFFIYLVKSGILGIPEIPSAVNSSWLQKQDPHW